MKKCNFISLGHIVKPHGNRGEVRVLLHTPEGGSSLKKGQIVRLELEEKEEEIEKEVETVREIAGKKKILCVKFKGVNNRNQAYQLVGFQVKTKEEELQPLEEDTYYFFQLKDCKVWDKENKFLGKVENILSAGGNDLLVVRKGDKEVLVPFVKSICLRIDLAKKKIIIDPPDGLLNLNEI